MAVRRPYWSGQIRLALVFLPVNVYNATRRTAQTPLHEYERKTGERIHHKNVNEQGIPVESSGIVKGYEVAKGDTVYLEKDELDSVKLPSSDTMELTRFVDRDRLSLLRLERPYFVTPNGKNATEIYAVIARALRDTGKVGIGQITLRGREELCALIPHEDGLVMQTLRYTEELYESDEFFDGLAKVKASADYVKLATQLIGKSSADDDLTGFHDRYHEAMRELIASKAENRRPVYKSTPKPEKGVDLLDALRQSLEGTEPSNDNRPPKKASKPTRKAEPKKKPASKIKAPAKRRKSA